MLQLTRDILDLIVDEIAAAEQRTSQLTACSLVSHSFHSRARVHLFSHINLRISPFESEHKQASRLVRILQHKKNQDLILHIIRSVKVFVNRCVWGCQGGWSSSARFPGHPNLLLSFMGVNMDPMLAALMLLKNAPLEKFILHGLLREFPYDPSRKIPTLLLEMCSIPTLKTLGFEKIRNLPYMFIMGRGKHHSGSFTRLILRDVSFVYFEWLKSPPPSVVSTIEGIETLELAQNSLSAFLMALHYLVPQLPLPLPLSMYFRNLKNLVLVFEGSKEREVLWNFILGFAEMLESLELNLEHAYPDKESDTPIIRPGLLDSLRSLRRLKIVSNFDWMRIVLASCTSPVHIRNVILETSASESIITSDKWLPIDAILSGPNFVDLRTVELRANKLSSALNCKGEEIDLTALLPTISSNPGISLLTSSVALEDDDDGPSEFDRGPFQLRRLLGGA